MRIGGGESGQVISLIIFSESRPIAAFFQPRNKFRKAEDLNQAPDTVELSAGSQGEISELHAVPVDISAEGEDPTETAVDSESDDDDLDVLGPPAEVSDSEPATSSMHGQRQARSVPGPNDLSQTVDDGPTQVYMRKYPTHIIGNISRRFNCKWYKNYTWLEYSTITDAVYCFHCRHFSIGNDMAAVRGQCHVFTHTGFRAWNRCTGNDPKTNAFMLHKNSDEHRFAVERLESYRAMDASRKTVVDMLDSEHRKQVTKLTIFL